MPRKPTPAQLAGLQPPVRTTEEARALAAKRQRGPKTTTSVGVSIPNDLLATIEASGEGRSALITRLLREWDEQRRSNSGQG